MTTGFCFDERTLWHSTGEAALFLKPGGWIQPLAAGGHAESPETKRRFKNLLDVSGLSRHLAVESARQFHKEPQQSYSRNSSEEDKPESSPSHEYWRAKGSKEE